LPDISGDGFQIPRPPKRDFIRMAGEGPDREISETANPGAFLRIGGDTQATEILLRQTVARAPGNAADRALTPPTEGST
jgi:hypothetical protein